ncbi:hypothetical protein A5893_01270 [Pedobacter psychrophilus]|uniref:Uncharacterized protein n=1 Tax=Pedobacter psychrophilus TaxID=1826909 RepID=A0A179DL46_9SPHI|nr:hypothetical protein A5893_01270 [Pedobacter psychrophilus]
MLFAYGQIKPIKFDKNGRVIEVSPIIKGQTEYDKLKNSFNTTTTAIDATLEEAKVDLIKDIIERLEASIKSLEGGKEQYSLLFEKVAEIRDHYCEARGDLQRLINTKPLSDADNINIRGLPLITDALKEVWDKKTDSATSLNLNKTFATFKIYKPSLANLFYAAHYNLVYADTKNPIYKSLGDRDLFAALNTFSDLLKSLEEKLKDPSGYREAHKLATIISKSELFLMFKEPWLAQLLWLNKAEPRVNPFDHTSEILLLNNPGWTLSEDHAYQAYLDALIKRKVSFDSSGNYTLFKQILAEKNLLKSRSTFNTIRDSLKKVSDQDFTKLKIGFTYLNLLKIPYNETSINERYYRSIMADNELIEGDDEDLKFLNAAETITWAVHNKVEGQTIKLNAPNKVALNATGKTEQEINRFFSEAASLFAVLNPNILQFNKFVNQITTPRYIQDPKKAFGEKPLFDVNELKFDGDVETLKKGNLYLKLLETSTLPPAPWTPNQSKIPIFETKLLKSEALDTLNTYKYTIQSILKKDTTLIDAVKFKVGKYVRFNLSGGLAYTFNAQSQNELNQDSQDNISFKSSSQSYRGIALFNLYFVGKGMLKPDDNILPKRDGCGRLFWQLGVGIPEPLTNFYSGVGYNIGPGLLFSTGIHLSGKNRYDVVNNEVIEEKKIYQPRGYVSISVEPGNLLKALGLFGK